MATRFGAASPARTYFAKVRWLVGGMLSLIAMLTCALIIIAWPKEESPDPPSATDQVAIASPVREIQVLIATQRVETGEELKPYMFTVSSVLEDQVGPRTVYAKDKDAVWDKYAQHMINAGQPLLFDDISDFKPLHLIEIPPGYRLTTIRADARQLVDGYATPNSRVDLLWTYKDRGQKRISTLIPAAKIASVKGLVNVQGRVQINSSEKPTVTLLVTEKDAKRIELARSDGTLSLSLLGRGEVPTSDRNVDTLTLAQLKNPNPLPEEIAETIYNGVMYTTDPYGNPVRYVLDERGRWKRDTNF